MRASLTVMACVAGVGSALLLPTAAAAQAAANRFVAIGCVSRQGTAAAPRFLLTDPRGDRPTVYRLAGKAEDLARHVGHTVEAAGTISTPAAAQPALTVTSLVWLRASCSK